MPGTEVPPVRVFGPFSRRTAEVTMARLSQAQRETIGHMKASITRRRSRRSLLLVLTIVGVMWLPAVGLAQEEPSDDAEAALLQTGFETFSANCRGCHQAGGVGIPGTFPPLLDNPRVQDRDYLITTVRNGKQGAIEVDGVEYDGVMPAFPTLTDEQVDGLVAYIQGGFQLPAGSGDEGGELPLATGTLPELTGMAIIAAFALAVGLAAFVLGPRIVGPADRLAMPWFDAWLRAGIIVVFFIGATVVAPSLVLQSETVSRLDRPVQDVLGSGLWIGGLAAGLWGLWYAHRENRI